MNNDNNLNGTVLGSVSGETQTPPVTNEGQQPEVEPQVVPNVENSNTVVMNEGVSTPNNEVIPPVSEVMVETPTPNVVEESQVVNEVPVEPTPSQVLTPNVPPVTPPPVNDVASQVVTPEPVNYSNPVNINPTPMPGFESSETFGTTPPISLEAEKKPEKGANKTLFVIIILIVLVAIGFGTFYVLKYTTLLNKAPQIDIKVHSNIQLNVGDAVPQNVSDYATITGTDASNCSLDTSNVNNKLEGIYDFKVICGEIIRNGQITVIDNRELEVSTKTVTALKGDTVEAKDFIVNPDSSITYEFVNSEEVLRYLSGDAGSHEITIKATRGTKVKEVTAKLVVSQYKVKGQLTCNSLEQNVSDINATMIVSEQFAIVDDGANGYGNYGVETYTFVFSNEEDYNKYKDEFELNKSITINEVTGNATFDDKTRTITITNELENDSVLEKYGEDNMKNYSTIKNHFTKTLGYTCTYKNS